MPSPKYTKIEITPEAYLALEAEAILHSKTLKKLASELILRGVSEESLEFSHMPQHQVKIIKNLMTRKWQK